VPTTRDTEFHRFSGLTCDGGSNLSGQMDKFFLRISKNAWKMTDMDGTSGLHMHRTFLNNSGRLWMASYYELPPMRWL
jgi:hypothetical protein